jgi:protein-tyrosine phosphatase
VHVFLPNIWAASGRNNMNEQKKIRILFICMGNICRSPSAEGVMRSVVAQAGLADLIEVDSAGTHDYHVGDAPDRRAAKAAARRGYDISGLRGRQVSDDDFIRFDMILAMDRDNLAILMRNCPPNQRHKLHLLLEYAQHFEEDEVPDPYYGGDAGFERVLDMVEDGARGLIESLRRA